MTPEGIILYLAENGVTVTGNTDQYFRLSPNGIKEWSVQGVNEPTEQDLAPYETRVTNGHHVSLARYKASTIEANQKEARSRIAAIIGKEVGDDLIYKEINMVASSVDDLRELTNELIAVMGKIIAGTAVAGDLTAVSITRLTSALSTASDNLASVKAIISAENTAATSINNAANHAAVDAISVSWPS